MRKTELKTKTDAVITDTKAALETVYNALSQGQQKKVLKDEAVAAVFKRYGVETAAE